MTDIDYLKWLKGIAYLGHKPYTGSSKPPRGYIKRLRFNYRHLYNRRRKAL